MIYRLIIIHILTRRKGITSLVLLNPMLTDRFKNLG
jgi:hypothetical protein